MTDETGVALTHTDVVVERLAAPVARVWAVLADHGAIGSYVAGLKVARVEGQGVGAVRVIANPAGEVRERLETLDPATHSLSYRLLDPSPLPMTNYVGSVRLAADGADGCRVEWSGRFATASVRDPQAQKRGLEQFYRGAIGGLRALLETA